jgi:hypothetical protein
LDSLKQDLINNYGVERGCLDNSKAMAISNEILNGNAQSSTSKHLSIFGNKKCPSRTQDGIEKTPSNINVLEPSGTSP